MTIVYHVWINDRPQSVTMAIVVTITADSKVSARLVLADQLRSLGNTFKYEVDYERVVAVE